MKRKHLFRIFILVLSLFMIAGCSKTDAPLITVEQTIVTEDDDLLITWSEVEDADAYQISIFLFPRTDERLYQKIELTSMSWSGSLQEGKYDIVVSSMKNEKVGESSEKVTVTVEPKSVPSWEELDLIFASSNEQIEEVIGSAFAESETGSAYIRSYSDPEYDLIYDGSKLTNCTQIDIYDSDYILLGMQIGENTQAELISVLNQNDILFENRTTDTSAGVSVSTSFHYNNYEFIVHIDNSNQLSYISIIK